MIELRHNHLRLVCDGCNAVLSVAYGNVAHKNNQDRERLAVVVGVLGWGIDGEQAERPVCAGEVPVTAKDILTDYKTYNEKLKNEDHSSYGKRSGDAGGVAGRTGSTDELPAWTPRPLFGAHKGKRQSN